MKLKANTPKQRVYVTFRDASSRRESVTVTVYDTTKGEALELFKRAAEKSIRKPATA